MFLISSTMVSSQNFIGLTILTCGLISDFQNRDLFLDINNLIVRPRHPALHFKTGLARHPVKGMYRWKHLKSCQVSAFF